MSSPPLNRVLLEISNQLSDQQLEDLKFLCRDWIGKRDQERIRSGTQLFQLLVERGQLGVRNTDTLSRLLEAVHRPDLSNKLDSYETQSGLSCNEPDPVERDKLDEATEVIVENLGKSWRKLGRKLGLKDVRLESISKKHPTELEETARELLKEWRRSRGAEARVQQLIEALRACQLNLTADKVEDRLLLT